MLRVRTLCVVVALALTTACQGSTQYGECVGLVGDKNPAKTYEVSFRNAVWTIIGIETTVVPIVWAGWYIWCPTGNAQNKKE